MASNQLAILVSFKQSEEDLYKMVKEHSGYSTWIKDLLKEHLKNNNQQKIEMNIPVFKEFE